MKLGVWMYDQVGKRFPSVILFSNCISYIISPNVIDIFL